MFSAWLTPPIVPLLKVYVFNITNGAQVLEGADPVTEEIGPYVYSATHIRTVVQADYQDVDSLSFLSSKLSVPATPISGTRIRQPDSAEHGDGDRVQQGQELHGDGEKWGSVATTD